LRETEQRPLNLAHCWPSSDAIASDASAEILAFMRAEAEALHGLAQAARGRNVSGAQITVTRYATPSGRLATAVTPMYASSAPLF